jgi:hypothetical protein
MRLRLRLLVLVVALLVSAVVTSPSAAIVNGKPDTQHPYVGLLLADFDGSVVPVCSGFLISPTVLATAGHCAAVIGDAPALVSFDQKFSASSELVSGTAVQNPDFDGVSFPDTHDVAVVLLDEPVTDRGFASLPSPGLLDSLQKKPSLTVVGYGAETFAREGGKPRPTFNLSRNFASARVTTLRSKNAGGFNIQLNASSARVCFGDSGGPVLLGDTHTVIGINSFVKNDLCAGGSFAYRTDTASTLAFLTPFL